MAKTSKSVLSVSDDYIPKDNNDLVRHYESFVALLVRRYNRVDSNFDDLLQHVWMKLIEVKIIDKYMASGSTPASLPKRMTAAQACGYLKVTWSQWKMIHWRAQKGDDRVADKIRVSKTLMSQVLDRDHGVCHHCGLDMHRLQLALEGLKKTDRAAWKVRRAAMASKGIPETKKVFWIAERTSVGDSLESFKTACLFCTHKHQPASVVRTKSAWAPAPVEGTWASRKALFNREDIERLKMMRETTRRCVKHDGVVEETPSFEPPKSRSLFKLYLARTVHNIYANWCRTRSRRYKEMYLAPTEDGQAWESFLEDPNGSRQEDMVSLYHAVKQIAAGQENFRNVDLTSKENEAKEVQILGLVADGYSLPEIVQKLSLPKAVLRAFAK